MQQQCWGLFIYQKALAYKRRSEIRQMDNKTKGAPTRVQSKAYGPQSARIEKHLPKDIKCRFKRAKQQSTVKRDTGEKRLVRG